MKRRTAISGFVLRLRIRLMTSLRLAALNVSVISPRPQMLCPGGDQWDRKLHKFERGPDLLPQRHAGRLYDHRMDEDAFTWNVRQSTLGSPKPGERVWSMHKDGRKI